MEFLAYAIAGGLMPDIIRLIKNRHGSLPEYLKNINFYIGLALLVALGIFAVYLKEPKDGIEAMAYAYAAPQIISSLLGKKLEAPSPGTEQQKKEINIKRIKTLVSPESKKPENFVSFIRNWW